MNYNAILGILVLVILVSFTVVGYLYIQNDSGSVQNNDTNQMEQEESTDEAQESQPVFRQASPQEEDIEISDIDEDGIPDESEELFNLDPTRVDTDGDGTSDFLEIHRNFRAQYGQDALEVEALNNANTDIEYYQIMFTLLQNQ